jgi:ATP-dependent DNA helicase RecQ
MGFDKPDLGFVVPPGRAGLPIAYYQQVGRAGRGVERAEVVLLPGGQEDEAIWRYFASLGFPREEQVRQVLAVLGRRPGRCRRPRSSRTSTCAAPGSRRCSRCSTSTARSGGSAAAGPRPGSRGTTTPTATRGWPPSGRRAADDARLRRDVRLPDAVPAPAARRPGVRRGHRPAVRPVRPVCTGRPLPAEVSADGARRRARRARQAGRRGRAAPDVAHRDVGGGHRPVREDPGGRCQAETGRALGRLSDVGWGTRLRPLLTGPDGLPADADLPDDVLRAVVDVLAGWGWATRPTGVVAVPSRTRPRLVGSLAARLAEVGRLAAARDAGARARRAARPGLSNSAQRLRAVHGAFAVPAGLALDGSPVLLVDDLVSTGWTLTEASRLLREAGAGPVLPLVLAVDG